MVIDRILFWMGIAGIAGIAVVFVLGLGRGLGTPDIDLGDMCEIFADGSAHCFDPDEQGGWYFERGTFPPPADADDPYAGCVIVTEYGTVLFDPVPGEDDGTLHCPTR